MNPESIAAAIERRRLDDAQVHTCVVPGCIQRAWFVFHADAPLRLAGRDWAAGEFVDLCPGHEQELRQAVDDAAALGYGGPYDTPDRPLSEVLATMGIVETGPIDRLREWR